MAEQTNKRYASGFVNTQDGKTYYYRDDEVRNLLKPQSIVVNGYEAVDLGMTTADGKHLLWATRNVGAESPTDGGLLFQFGRTDGYAYGDTNHQFSTDKRPATMSGTVYRAGETLALADDAANANMGGNWRMPTKAEMEALAALNFTNTTENGVYGIKFTHNENSIFIPAAGYYSGYSHSFKDSGSLGKVGHSSLETGLYSSVLLFSSKNLGLYLRECYDGCSVRGVIELTDEELLEYYTKSLVQNDQAYKAMRQVAWMLAAQEWQTETTYEAGTYVRCNGWVFRAVDDTDECPYTVLSTDDGTPIVNAHYQLIVTELINTENWAQIDYANFMSARQLTNRLIEAEQTIASHEARIAQLEQDVQMLLTALNNKTIIIQS